MQTTRKYALSIAGFDPSGGAGLLADIKTFEQCGVYGLGVCTSLTFQNDIEFAGLEWVSPKSILAQLEILLKRFPVEVVKIGLVEDMEMLLEIVTALKKWNTEIKIIWDPILKSSTGFLFHDKIEKQFLEKILSGLYLLTPNRHEIIKMGDTGSEEEVAAHLSKYCPVLLKGGHDDNETKADDLLFTNNESESITGERIYGKEKHGTGCVLSSAIGSFVAHGFTLTESCQKAKGYVHSFISSADDLLGWHHSIVFSESHV